MALQRNEPIFISTEDEQKYRQLQASFKSACERIHELSEFILKLKTAEFNHAPKLAISLPSIPNFIEITQITKSDRDLFWEWKSLIQNFDL
jgi:hypothetical protein